MAALHLLRVPLDTTEHTVGGQETGSASRAVVMYEDIGK